MHLMLLFFGTDDRAEWKTIGIDHEINWLRIQSNDTKLLDLNYVNKYVSQIDVWIKIGVINKLEAIKMKQISQSKKGI